jgi:proteic killer suppression protein
VIVSIRHKGLKELFEKGTTRGVIPQHGPTLRMQLIALDTALDVEDMNVPGWRLHTLKGNHGDRWSLSVDKNWRVTFEFHDGNAYLLDYEDYH